MDKYDRMLLAALLDNGRATFAQLARQVNLSAPAVKRAKKPFFFRRFTTGGMAAKVARPRRRHRSGGPDEITCPAFS